MKASLCITVLALAALSSANDDELCKGQKIHVSEDLMLVSKECRAQNHDDVPEEEQFYLRKCCEWKHEKFMVVDHDGKFHWDKFKTIIGGAFGNGVGEGVADRAKENCNDKVEGAKFEAKDPKGMELVKCIVHSIEEECKKKE